MNTFIEKISKIAQKKQPKKICLKGIEESTKLIKKKGLCRNPIIIDGGANQGWSVDIFLEKWPKAKVLAVEPLPGLARQMKRKYADRQTVIVEQAALWEENGVMELNECQKMVVSSMLTPIEKANEFWGAEFYGVVKNHTVTTFNLSTLMERHNIGNVDILKLDLQGAECNVLRGALDLFQKRKIRYVICEVLFHDLYKGQGSAGDILNHMKKCGFVIRGVYEQMYLRNELVQMDFLFEQG